MLIRRPAAAVFDAFVNPETIRKFWLANTSGPLAPAAQVHWEFMVPGATETVTVTAFDPPQRIAFDWSSGIHVELIFAQAAGGTRLNVGVSGFKGGDAVTQLAGTVEGFSIVICDLKALLESGQSANLVRDKAELISRALKR